MDLNKINAERRRRGLPPLSQHQAVTALSSRDSANDAIPFLLGYVVGSSLAESTYSTPDPAPSYSGGGGDFGGGGSSSSYDSGSSSSSDSGSSSSSGGGD